MDNESKSTFKEIQIKRNFNSVDVKANSRKEDSVFLGQDNLEKLKNFQK